MNTDELIERLTALAAHAELDADDVQLLHEAADRLNALRAASVSTPDGRTHHAGCWDQRGHHDCAISRVRELEGANESLRGQLGRLRAQNLRETLYLCGVDPAVKEYLCPTLNKGHPDYRVETGL